MRILDTGKSSAQIRQLGRREQEILNLVVDGQTSKEIGNALGITEGTVNTVVGTLLQVLGARNRVELTKMGYRYDGLLRDGRIALGPHPRGCTCGFSYCPDRQLPGPAARMGSTGLSAMATA